MKYQKGFTVSELMFSLVAIIGAVGWISNLITLFNLMTCTFTLETLLRVIGIIIFPIGCIMGYIPTGSGC